MKYLEDIIYFTKQMKIKPIIQMHQFFKQKEYIQKKLNLIQDLRKIEIIKKRYGFKSKIPKN